jgi:hypothetical protein
VEELHTFPVSGFVSSETGLTIFVYISGCPAHGTKGIGGRIFMPYDKDHFIRNDPRIMRSVSWPIDS